MIKNQNGLGRSGSIKVDAPKLTHKDHKMYNLSEIHSFIAISDCSSTEKSPESFPGNLPIWVKKIFKKFHKIGIFSFLRNKN